MRKRSCKATQWSQNVFPWSQRSQDKWPIYKFALLPGSADDKPEPAMCASYNLLFELAKNDVRKDLPISSWKVILNKESAEISDNVIAVQKETPEEFESRHITFRRPENKEVVKVGVMYSVKDFVAEALFEVILKSLDDILLVSFNIDQSANESVVYSMESRWSWRIMPLFEGWNRFRHGG